MAKSPCCRVCKINYDEVCIGCGRTLAEIIGWSVMTEEEQQEVLKTAADRLRELERKK
jgi:hypothetical protein